MSEIEDLNQEILVLKKRNQHVEAEKAWETSFVRVGSIMFVTYIFAAILLRLIGASNYLLGAFVPVLEVIGNFVEVLGWLFGCRDTTPRVVVGGAG